MPLWGTGLVVPPGKIENDPVRWRSWWGDKLPRLKPGTALIYAFQRAQPGLGSYIPVLWHGPLPSHAGGLVSICVTGTEDGVTLGDSQFKRALEMRPTTRP